MQTNPETVTAHEPSEEEIIALLADVPADRLPALLAEIQRRIQAEASAPPAIF